EAFPDHAVAHLVVCMQFHPGVLIASNTVYFRLQPLDGNTPNQSIECVEGTILAREDGMRLLTNRSLVAATATLLWLSPVGCGPNTLSTNPSGGASGGAGGTGGGGGHLGGDGSPGPIDPNPDGPRCGEMTFRLERAGTPDILIVLDRSGSM